MYVVGTRKGAPDESVVDLGFLVAEFDRQRVEREGTSQQMSHVTNQELTMSTVTESKTIKLANDLVKCADFLNKHADLFDKLSDTDSEDYRLAYLGLSVYSQTVELY